MSKLTPRQEFLNSFYDATEEFKQACDLPVLGDDCIEVLKSIQSRGRYLVRGINDIVSKAHEFECKLTPKTPGRTVTSAGEVEEK